MEGTRTGLAAQHASRLATRAVLAVFLQRTALLPLIIGGSVSFLIAGLAALVASAGMSLSWILAGVATGVGLLFVFIGLIIFGVIQKMMPRHFSFRERRDLALFHRQLLRRLELDNVPLPLFTWRVLSQTIGHESGAREISELTRAIQRSPLLSKRFEHIEAFFVGR